MPDYLSRREFLNLGGLALGSFAAQPLRSWLPPEDRVEPIGIGRVTIGAIRVYQEPHFKSEGLRWLRRDKLVGIIEETISPHGPPHNPRWYRVPGGYAHRAYLQRVENSSFIPPLASLPDGGQLGEVTVPYTRSFRITRSDGWQPLYRLYFGSVYWITHLIEGLDGQPWYGLTDGRLRTGYQVPAAHIRPILKEEVTPLSPHVPPGEKRIDVSLAEQVLRAYEGERLVFQADIASGIPSRGPSPNGIPTDTPHGNFHISLKLPSRHMGDGNLTDEIDAYELPGVPWVSYFHAVGVGFHGTYWHDNFGASMSRGCVNMRNADAKWIYRWTTPEIGYSEWYKKGWGTLVKVE